jgi:hypothetical protein
MNELQWRYLDINTSWIRWWKGEQMGLFRWGKFPVAAFLFLLLASFLTACDSAIDVQETVITEEANVESVAIIVIGQTPVKIHASVKGTYPNDCTLVYEIQQDWEEEVYKILIKTKRPIEDEQCQEGPIPFEEIYEIPVFQLEAGEYIVDVNGVQEPLVFVFDNE